MLFNRHTLQSFTSVIPQKVSHTHHHYKHGLRKIVNFNIVFVDIERNR